MDDIDVLNRHKVGEIHCFTAVSLERQRGQVTPSTSEPVEQVRCDQFRPKHIWWNHPFGHRVSGTFVLFDSGATVHQYHQPGDVRDLEFDLGEALSEMGADNGAIVARFLETDSKEVRG